MNKLTKWKQRPYWQWLWIVTMAIFSAPAAYAAQPSLASIQQQLAQQNIVRGDFTQTRRMQMFDAPLVSQGKFVLSRDQGLWWQQTHPFPTSLVLTKNTLSQQIGSEPAQILKVSDNPMVFYFSHVFLSLFKGDTSALTEQFTLSFSSQTDQHWVLSLTPKSSPLDKVFSSIEIAGQQDINKVALMEIRGDSTVIEFSNQTQQPDSLTAAEHAIFAIQE